MDFQTSRFSTTTTPMFHLNRSRVMSRPDIPVCDSGRLFIPGKPSVDVVYLRDWQKQMNIATHVPQEQQTTEAAKMAKFKAQGQAAADDA